MGWPDFERPTAHLAPLVAHALHDDNADGDIAKAVHDGLSTEVVAELEPALPLGYKWRVPLT